MELNERVEAIEFRFALEDLILRYQQAADRHDWTAWAACFTEDAIYEIPSSFGVMRGREAIHDQCKADMHDAFEKMQHIIVNQGFERSGTERAKGQANFVFAATPHARRPGKNYVCGGRYRWEFRLCESIWLISRASAEYLWHIGNATGGAFSR